jgi:hypothetical protein
MNRTAIAGWAISLLGTALWIYGYFVTGNPSLVNWSAITPSWTSEFLPNIESEIAMVLAFAGPNLLAVFIGSTGIDLNQFQCANLNAQAI